MTDQDWIIFIIALMVYTSFSTWLFIEAKKAIYDENLTALIVMSVVYCFFGFMIFTGFFELLKAG